MSDPGTISPMPSTVPNKSLSSECKGDSFMSEDLNISLAGYSCANANLSLFKESESAEKDNLCENVSINQDFCHLGDGDQFHKLSSSSILRVDVLESATSVPESLQHFNENSIFPTTVHPVRIDVNKLIRENLTLREKLKEISCDRDRLLCEVFNLRLEMNMSELKKLPEESFPQKVVDRPTQGQYAAAPIGATSATPSPGVEVVSSGSYVYLQPKKYSSSSNSINPAATINNSCASQQQIAYQQQQYPMCHQHAVKQLPAIIAVSGNMGGGGGISSSSTSANSQMTLSSSPAAVAAGGFHHNHYHHQHHHHMHHLHHHGGAVVIAGSSVGTGAGMGSGGNSPSCIQQSLHKKNSIRSGGDILKRSRAQTAYELSQDLLEKQIELLERKYGGVRARNAAVIIQRAFRHYMMVKKFASITAMAKAEKRLSRRMMTVTGDDVQSGNSPSSSAYDSATECQGDIVSGNEQHNLLQQQQQPRVTIMAGPPCSGVGEQACSVASVAGSGATIASTISRTPPSRSLSLRERRYLDSSPLPRTQSGPSPLVPQSTTSSSSHPHVNLLHAAEQHLFSGQIPGQPTQIYHYANTQCTYHAIPHDSSFSSSSSHLDSGLNMSWVSASGSLIGGASPHTPYYSAAQIYMRPKTLTASDRRKIPPEVPKRTSSITAQQQSQQLAQQHQQVIMVRQTPPPASIMRSNGLSKNADNGSLTSVQSSGSDSSITSADRIANCDLSSDRSNSPHNWKRGSNLNSSNQFTHSPDHIIMMTSHPPSSAVVVVGNSDDHMSSHTSAAQYEQHDQQDQINVAPTTQNYKVSETIRKRQYRVGLNLFNKKPEKGITYLIRRGFLENTPQGVARFLISRKGLSRQMIGEYLGNLQNQFNMAVLDCFAGELDLSGMQVDVALRKFQAYFRMPGEAQKIERLMEVFSHRYCQCNQDIVGRLRSSDTIFVLAFAIIMLNTDLHTPNLKPDRRMRVEDFIKNLRGIDDCHDIDRDMLAGIYERVKANEFKPGSDHVTQVMKVQATIVGKKQNLALPHRRLVCYCRLYEIPDVNKKERPGVHQREVFLFNDLLVITKIFSKKKSSVTYTFRNSFPLCGMVVSLLDVPNYPFCIQLSQKVDGKILITFNARNEHDRCKFAEDLKESISEMDEMESLRIEAELERQKSARNRVATTSENRDSGVADVEVCPCPFQSPQNSDPPNGLGETTQQLKRSALSNSLLDMHEQFGNEKPQRRGSVGSLDSGMSISFQSTTASSASRENAAVVAAAANSAHAVAKIRFPSLGAANVSNHLYPSVSHHHIIHGHHHPTLPLSHQQVAISQHHVVQQPQQQQTPTGRIPGRERKLSRSDESGRSTEV